MVRGGGNNTLYVLIYFISKGLDYSTVITTLHYITANGVYIFTAPYCTLRHTLGFQVCVIVGGFSRSRWI